MADASLVAGAPRKLREKRGAGAARDRGREQKVSSRGSNFSCFRVGNLHVPRESPLQL